jgi:hypothetical protein
MGFEAYWAELQVLARNYGERVWDQDAWRENFDAGQSAEEAFYGEYPEHKPKETNE